MNRVVPKLLIALTCASLTAGLVWVLASKPILPPVAQANDSFAISEPTSTENSGNGTEICARCGARREVSNAEGRATRYTAVATPEEAWSTARIGACPLHWWQETGDWSFTRRTADPEEVDHEISCTMLAEHHVLWRALANLDEEHATEMARRFASLPGWRQIELWRESNSTTSDSTDRQLARSVARNAGWGDLSGYWWDGPQRGRAR